MSNEPNPKSLIWKCRFCGGQFDLPSKCRSTFSLSISEPSPHILNISWTVCPNLKCQEVTLVAKLYSGKKDGGQEITRGEEIKRWPLLPGSKGKSFSKSIPAHLITDYEEACAIKDLSPKASATLSRRCLQGIVRDFWKTKPGRLVDELVEIKDKIEPGVWEAIDTVRKVGNIGAHFKEDANQILEVDSKEAVLLIHLIEKLFEDWYETRQKKQELLEKLKIVAQKKTEAKKKTDA